jgi:hypothetical protein
MLEFSPFSVFNLWLTDVKLSLYQRLANPSQTIGRLTMNQSKKPHQKNLKTAKQEASPVLAATTKDYLKICIENLGGN